MIFGVLFLWVSETGFWSLKKRFMFKPYSLLTSLLLVLFSVTWCLWVLFSVPYSLAYFWLYRRLVSSILYSILFPHSYPSLDFCIYFVSFSVISFICLSDLLPVRSLFCVYILSQSPLILCWVLPHGCVFPCSMFPGDSLFLGWMVPV